MGFFDSHVHLHFPDYDKDQSEVIERSRRAGVDLFMNVGTDPESSRSSLKIANQHDFIWASAGIHPHDAKEATDEAFREIETLLREPKMVAIGEVGLDYFRDISPRETQETVLKRFIELHRKIKKPLILHCRDAYDDLIRVFREMMSPPYQGVIHCFSGDSLIVRKLLDLGFYISFAGPLTYKKNDALREACKLCPLDRLILETDAPFLPPQSKRGLRNESAFLIETAQMAADIHYVNLSQLEERTQKNTRAAFGL